MKIKRSVLASISVFLIILITLILTSCSGKDVYGCARCQYFDADSASCEDAPCCSDRDCGQDMKCIYPGEKSAQCIDKRTCYDGTEQDECSINELGKACYFGKLLDKCNLCGCGKGRKCVDYSCVKYDTAILLVHGFNDDSMTWKNFRSWFDEDNIRNVYTIDLLPSIGNITLLSYQLKDRVRNIINGSKYEKIDIVAHSMGGIVAREYIASKDYKNEINKLIMIGTPNQGVGFSSFDIFFSLNDTIAAKQMAKNSDFMIDLNGHPLNKDITYFIIAGVKYDAYGSKYDGLVFEDEAMLENVSYKTFELSHLELLSSKDVYNIVKEKLLE